MNEDIAVWQLHGTVVGVRDADDPGPTQLRRHVEMFQKQRKWITCCESSLIMNAPYRTDVRSRVFV